MIIKGTNKIKGVVDLYSIKKQLTKDAKYTIKDSEFWNSDVQAALGMGLITAEQPPNSKDQPPQDEAQVVCRNAHSRPITVLNRPTQVMPNQTFTLSQDELQMPDIQKALAKNMISVVSSSSAKPNQEEEEGVVTVSQIIAQEEAKAEQKKREEKWKQMENANRRNIDLDTNEELSTPSVIDEEEPNPVQAPDQRSVRSVIWNPTHAPLESENVKKFGSSDKVIDTEKPDAVDSNEGDPRRSAMVVEKEKSDEINFVDKQERIDRIKSHPKLKDKELPEEEEPDFVDPDEERRQKHPKLKDKKPNDEIDFVDLD
jgi:hypothetical protein